jgi:hypothetical protein
MSAAGSEVQVRCPACQARTDSGGAYRRLNDKDVETPASTCDGLINMLSALMMLLICNCFAIPTHPGQVCVILSIVTSLKKQSASATNRAYLI